MRICTAVLVALTVAGCGTDDPTTPASSFPASGSSGSGSSGSGSPSGPTPSARPTFADVTTGDTESIVKLLAYDPAALSAVVEPIIFMQGPDFCAAFDLPDSDPRCNREWATEDSHTKVTLPLSAKAKLLTTNGAVEECMDWTRGIGKCAWRKADLAERAKDDPGTMVRLTTRAGTITQIAEIYTP